MQNTRHCIDPQKEEVIPLAVLAREMTPPVNYRTVYYWFRYGRLNQWTQRRVHLEVLKMPCGMATSREAYWRFIKRLNEID